MTAACINCARLGSCKTVRDDPNKVLTNYRCPLWKATDEGAVAARQQAIADLGQVGLKAIVTAGSLEDEE